MSQSKKRVHATFEIEYIPGLAAPGGRPGEGLGSRLLGSLRDCDALLFVLRAGDGVDPADQLRELELELVLADLASVEQRLTKQRRALKGDKSLAARSRRSSGPRRVLGEGVPVFRSDADRRRARPLLTPVFLLTNKPVLVVVNVGVDDLDARPRSWPRPFGDGALAVCIELESDPDVVRRRPGGAAALLADLGVGRERAARASRASAYHLLGRRTFLTTGEDETRAWSFRSGARAPECAGVIHSDLQRGFIRAEVIHWDELLEIGSWAKAKELGKLRVEGKDYEVARRRRARDPLQRVGGGERPVSDGSRGLADRFRDGSTSWPVAATTSWHRSRSRTRPGAPAGPARTRRHRRRARAPAVPQRPHVLHAVPDRRRVLRPRRQVLRMCSLRPWRLSPIVAWPAFAIEAGGGRVRALAPASRRPARGEGVTPAVTGRGSCWWRHAHREPRRPVAACRRPALPREPADVIAAEDTRRTRALLTHAGIPAGGRLRAVHDAQRARRPRPSGRGRAPGCAGRGRHRRRDAERLRSGRRGRRGGSRGGRAVEVVPGPSAVLTALVLSGLPADRFVFEGFLPRRGRRPHRPARRRGAEPRTVVLFEAPHRVRATLADLAAAAGADRPVVGGAGAHEDATRRCGGARSAARWRTSTRPSPGGVHDRARRSEGGEEVASDADLEAALRAELAAGASAR